MLTKERCMSLLDDIAGYAHRANIGPNGINEINEDYNGLKKLIEEHFTPQPLEFNDLKEGMWVYYDGRKNKSTGSNDTFIRYEASTRSDENSV